MGEGIGGKGGESSTQTQITYKDDCSSLKSRITTKSSRQANPLHSPLDCSLQGTVPVAGP